MELCFALGPLRLNRELTKKGDKKKMDTSDKGSFEGYREIVKSYFKIFAHSEVFIRNITIPCDIGEDIATTVTRPWRYYGVIYSILTFLRANAKRLIIDDNAIILNSDSEKLMLDITLKIRLFRIIGTLAVFIFNKKIMKKKAA